MTKETRSMQAPSQSRVGYLMASLHPSSQALGFRLPPVIPRLFAVSVLAALIGVAASRSFADSDPNSATGFVKNAFDSSSIDNVNLFNGNLVITIPIASYRVDGIIGYGITLTYNSKIWGYSDAKTTSSSGDKHYTMSAIDMPSPLGVGWSMDLGHIWFDSFSTRDGKFARTLAAGGTPYFFIGPDGGFHRLYDPNGSVSTTSRSSVFFTKDGSNLRVKVTTSNGLDALDMGILYTQPGTGGYTYRIPDYANITGWTVESGDGLVYEFTNNLANGDGYLVKNWDVIYNYELAQHPLPDYLKHGDGWYVAMIYDHRQANKTNPVKLSYYLTPTAKFPGTLKSITDSHRTSGEDIVETVLDSDGFIQKLLVPKNPGAARSQYIFTYNKSYQITRAATDNSAIYQLAGYTAADRVVNAPMLMDIALPDGTNGQTNGSHYHFDYNTNFCTDTTPGASNCANWYDTNATQDGPGTLRRMLLPTGGVISYDYIDFQMAHAHMLYSQDGDSSTCPGTHGPPRCYALGSLPARWATGVWKRHQMNQKLNTSGAWETARTDTIYDRLSNPGETSAPGSGSVYFPMLVTSLKTYCDNPKTTPRQSLVYFGTNDQPVTGSVTGCFPNLGTAANPKCNGSYGLEFLREDFDGVQVDNLSDYAINVAPTLLGGLVNSPYCTPDGYISGPDACHIPGLIRRTLTLYEYDNSSDGCSNPDVTGSLQLFDVDRHPRPRAIVTEWLHDVTAACNASLVPGGGAGQSVVTGSTLTTSGGWSGAHYDFVTTASTPNTPGHPPNTDDLHETFVGWDPPPADTSGSWLTETVGVTSVYEKMDSVETSFSTFYGFDASTGFMNTMRILNDASQTDDTKDIEHVYTPDAYGNISHETIRHPNNLPNESFGLDFTYQCGIKKTEQFSGAPGGFYSLHFDVDCASGLTTTQYDQSGVRSSLHYDGLGRATSVVPEDSPDEATSTIAYNTATFGGIPGGVTDAPVFKLNFTTATRDPGGLRSVIGYDGLGRAIANYHDLPNGLGASKETTLDGLGKVLHDVEWRFNARPGSNPITVPPVPFGEQIATCGGSSNPAGKCFSYDGLGRAISVSQADGSVATTSYEGDWFTSTSVSVDGVNSVTSSTADFLGNLRKIVDPAGSITTYRYNPDARLVNVTQNGTQQRQFQFNHAGFMTSDIQPEKNNLATTHTFNVLGSPLTKTEPDGTITTYVYDAAGRLQFVKDSNGHDLRAFTYGLTGRNLAKITETSSYNRISNGWLNTAIRVVDSYNYQRRDSDPKAVGLGGRIWRRGQKIVDANGSSGTAYFDPTEREWTYDYNSLGFTNTVSYPRLTGSSTLTKLVTLNDAGYSSSQLVGVNGAAPTTNLANFQNYWPTGSAGKYAIGYVAASLTTTWTQDSSGMGRPSQIDMSIAGVATPALTLGAYAYDGAGNITWIGRNGAPKSTSSGSGDLFHYDGNSHLISAGLQSGATEQYCYDAFGNLTSKAPVLTGCPSTPPHWLDANTNRLQTDTIGTSGIVAAYDGRGNVKQWGEQLSWYDELDRVLSFDDAKTGRRWIYIYNAGGERVGKSRIDPSTGQVLSTSVDYRDIDESLLAHWEGDSIANVALEKEYFYGAGRLLASHDVCSGTSSSVGWRYFATDHLGTPRLTLDSTGKIWRHDFLPFGEELPDGIADAESHRFTGHERDGESGFDYMHARYYTSAMGRFLSVDSHGGSASRPMTWNRYAYAGNNPIGWVDPNAKLAYPWHVILTYQAARANGWGWWNSVKVAFKAANVDFKNFSTFKTNPEETMKHGMQTLFKGKLYSRAEIDAMSANWITTNVEKGTIDGYANASHTVVDQVTPLHLEQIMGTESYSFLNGSAWKHLGYDLFPSEETKDAAVKALMEILPQGGPAEEPEEAPTQTGQLNIEGLIGEALSDAGVDTAMRLGPTEDTLVLINGFTFFCDRCRLWKP